MRGEVQGDRAPSGTGRHRQGVTTSALATILDNIRKDPPSEALSAWTINNFIKSEYKHVSGKVELPLEGGGVFGWSICRPDKLLRHLALESSEFASALAEAAQKAGPNPLRSIWYLDEVVPGNILRPDNARRFWAIYMSLAEFGSDRLFCAEWWMPIGVLRSSVANSVLGGVSQCMRQLLRYTLFEPCNMGEVGTTLELSVPTLLRFRVAHIIADESALKALWNAKGASGTRPCMLCANVLSKHSGLGSSHPRLVDITCSDAGRFQLVGDEDIWRAFDSLAADQHRLSRADFALAERASGTCWRSSGLRRLSSNVALHF